MVGVGFGTTEGTAAADEDYTSTAGEVEWASGSSLTKTVAIPLLDGLKLTETSIANFLAVMDGVTWW